MRGGLDLVLQLGLLFGTVPFRTMLGAEYDGLDAGGLVVDVFDGDLTLRIGAKVGDDVVLPNISLLGHQLVGKVDGQRHQ